MISEERLGEIEANDKNVLHIASASRASQERR